MVKWELYRKAKKVVTGTCDAKTQFDAGANQWNTITLEGKGNTINAYVNYMLVGSYTDEQPITAGRIALGKFQMYIHSLTIWRSKSWTVMYRIVRNC